MNPDPRLDRARVRAQREITPGFFWLELELPPEYPPVAPGQYLNLRLQSALFRRPFGVVESRPEDEATVVELFYAVVGPGTREMSGWRPGDEVDCLGPLGTPYAVDPGRPALLVAGGRGAAPLLFLYRLLKADHGHDLRFAFGVRSRDLLFGLDRIDEEDLLIASEDGSAGVRGTVLEAVEQAKPRWLQDRPTVYACGPEALLAASAAFSREHGLDCQVSLEGVYGCGLGLCRGCAVPLRGEDRYLMQCIDGPVLDAARIDWERMHV